MSGELKEAELEELKETVLEMKPKVDRLYDVMFVDEDDIDQRQGIDDIRLMRQLWHRFKSVRLIIGFIVGISTAVFAIVKLVELIAMFFKSKGG